MYWDAGTCACTHDIQVANCGGQYFVYYLYDLEAFTCTGCCTCANTYCASNVVPANLAA